MKMSKQTRTIEESFAHGFSEEDYRRCLERLKASPKRRKRQRTLAMEPVAMASDSTIPAVELDAPSEAYIDAVCKGLVKVHRPTAPRVFEQRDYMNVT